MPHRRTEELPASLREVNYDSFYRDLYPSGVDLRPGRSDQHEELLQMVMDRALASRRAMATRRQVWRDLDRTITAFIPLDEEEEGIRKADDRRPVSIVVPLSYAVMETLLTHAVLSFAQQPIFRYEGQGPEDVLGAILLEKLIEVQATRSKMFLALHTMWRDSIIYGFGVTAVGWERKLSRRSVSVDLPDLGATRSVAPAILYEGNKLVKIDPYRYLPDPNVPINEVQSGEFVGWSAMGNRMGILRREENRQGGIQWFNGRYMKHTPGTSQLFEDDREEGNEGGYYRDESNKVEGTNPAHEVYMYLDLVPKEHGLSESDSPEKWLFVVGGDEVILAAQPADLHHDMFPVAVCSPDYDGHSLQTTSRLEIVFGMQRNMDFLMNSRMKNLKKSVNNVTLVDPTLVNMLDLETAKEGGIVRLRQRGWGRGKEALEGAMKQMEAVDVTRGFTADMAGLADMVDRTSGAVDSLQGVMRTGSGDRSAAEFTGTQRGGLSRLERIVRVGIAQAHYDLGLMMGSNVQQFMRQDQYVDVSGRWQEKLATIFGLVDQIRVNPTKVVKEGQHALIDVFYNVVPNDGGVKSSQFADTWLQLFQILATAPELAVQFDMPRIFKHVATLMGATNVEDFTNAPAIQTTVLPDEQVQAQAQAGNLVPLNGQRA